MEDRLVKSNRTSLPSGISPELQEEYCRGFYPDRLANWIEQRVRQEESPSFSIQACLADLAAGRRDFGYPGHDTTVFRLLSSLVAERNLRKGADIGCESGCFPAMQLVCGIEKCTMFEIRQVCSDHPRVEVRLCDLSKESDLKPEFDLLTCLSTIEHVGLGRYGDALDPWGDMKLAKNLRKLVRPGGIILLSFPVGVGCVVFNLHRIYTSYRRDSLFEGYRLLSTHRGLSLGERIKFTMGGLLKGRLGRGIQPVHVLEPR